MPKKIGLLGGTFDPIHNGHLAIASQALKQLQLDQIQFIPCYLPTHRASPQASAADRLAMVTIATQKTTNFTVNKIELDRQSPSYTVDTVKALYKPNQQLYLIIGADNYIHFDKWRSWQEIICYCQLVVYNRPGYDTSAIKHSEIMHNATILQMPPSNLSATEIRRRIKEKSNIADAIPKEAYQYIKAKQLYTE